MTLTLPILLQIVTLLSVTSGAIWAFARLSTSLEHLTAAIEALRDEFRDTQTTLTSHGERIARLEASRR